MITGITNLKAVEKEARRRVKNAQSRALNKVGKKAIEEMMDNSGLKSKKIFRNSKVFFKVRPKQNDLTASIWVSRTRLSYSEIQHSWNERKNAPKAIGLNVREITLAEKIGYKTITLEDALKIKPKDHPGSFVMSKKPINQNGFRTSVGKVNSYYRGKNGTKITRTEEVHFLNRTNVRLCDMVDRNKLNELADEAFMLELEKENKKI